MSNIDDATVAGFGDEWSHFDQRGLSDAELSKVFEQYFSIFPWVELSEDAEGFDLGCGSGRWAARVAPSVGRLHCIDASDKALAVARRNLSHLPNCEFHPSSVDAIPLADASMDFGYSLGVLHHVPDTAAGLAACVQKLKPGAPFLVYLYYDFEGRPVWFRTLWKASDLLRRKISVMPHRPKVMITTVIAATVYFPLAVLARFVERAGRSAAKLPLSYYKHLSFYTMRTDAFDRFGTKLEQRFSREEIRKMMSGAGLERIVFSDFEPYWCALGYKLDGRETV